MMESIRLPSRAECAELIAEIDVLIAKSKRITNAQIRDMLRQLGFDASFVNRYTIKRLATGVEKALSAEAKRVLAALNDAFDIETFYREEMPDIEMDSRLALELRRLFRRTFEAIMPQLVRSYSAKIDNQLVIDSISKRTTAFIDSWSQDLAVLMKLSTDKELRKLLRNALENGESVQQLAQRIMDSDIRNTYGRARRVALTELLRAHSYAAQEAMDQNPAVSGKRWVHTGARFNKPRPNHVAMNGTVVPKGQPFVLTGADGGIYSPMVPRDTCLPAGEAVNCHCVVQPVVDDRILGLAPEERQRLREEALAKMDDDWMERLDLEKHRQADEWRRAHGEIDQDSVDEITRRLKELEAKKEASAAVLFTSPTLPDDYKTTLRKRFADMPETARRAYTKYAPADGGVVDDKSGYFQPASMEVHLRVADDSARAGGRGAGTTYFHEYGHYIDYASVNDRQEYTSCRTQEYRNALIEDRKNLEARVKKEKGFRRIDDVRIQIGETLSVRIGSTSAGVQDILSGTINRPYPGSHWSHSAGYWKSGADRLPIEAFANMYEATSDPEKTALMEEYFPKAWPIFLQMLEDIT